MTTSNEYYVIQITSEGPLKGLFYQSYHQSSGKIFTTPNVCGVEEVFDFLTKAMNQAKWIRKIEPGLSMDIVHVVTKTEAVGTVRGKS